MSVRQHLQSRPDRHAVTLCELVIVLLFISIMAAVALPKWSAFLHQRRVIAAANRIAADIQRVKAAAYSTSTPQSIVFDTTANQYTISGLPSLNSSSGTYVVQLGIDPYYSRLTSVFGQTGSKTLTYNGYGDATSGGNIVVASAGVQKTVVVNAASGKAVVQ